MCTISTALHVCPIKRLYLMIEQEGVPPKSAAVLCTMEAVCPDKMGTVPFLHIPFADILNQADPRAFCSDQAAQIRRFVDGCADISDLYFCCDSGESRSAALAAATMHYLGQNEMTIWKNVRFHPNTLVYYLQSKAYDLPVTEDDAQELYQYNQMCFARKIRSARKTTDQSTVL